MVSIADIDPYEDKLGVVYLDHSPVRSALYTIDRDVGRAIEIAARHMSAAWATIAPDEYLMDWRWINVKEPTPPGELDSLRAEVRGQRVLVYRPPGTFPEHPAAKWAYSQGGNYHWLWQNAMELLGIWRKREGTPHPMAPTIYTLEVMPPVLLESSCDRSEPPVTMQSEYHVQTPDGMYLEAVDSWRKYYVKRRQALLRWQGRGVPDWLERTADGFRLKKQAL